ncbi:hypothetical protein ElyMa_005957500 [Elysia marginata]|uniref:EGF-like domain-containing protein n=1 Tax=Elysia marginata TaxID=1093978 RepID=A0AAV4GCC6_9GAST|nr:hypothetical protein ElyMa_005957500 [Elysia marginata]
MELVEVESSSLCEAANFHLPGQDYTLLRYNIIAGANTNYTLDTLHAPVLTNRDTGNDLCPLFVNGTCKHDTFKGIPCWCDKVDKYEYYLTYNRTADLDISNATVVMKWLGRESSSPLISRPYTFKEIAKASITLVEFNSTFKTSTDFLVAGLDSTVLQLDVYGEDFFTIPEHRNRPQFYFMAPEGVYHTGCSSFDSETGDCINQTRVTDSCSCEVRNSCTYRITYTLRARVPLSGATVFLLWPGVACARSDNYTLPEIRGKERLMFLQVSVGASLGVFLIVSTVGLYDCYCIKRRVPHSK